MNPITYITSKDNYYQVYPKDLVKAGLLTAILSTLTYIGTKKLQSRTSRVIVPLQGSLKANLCFGAFAISLFALGCRIFEVAISKKGVVLQLIHRAKKEAATEEEPWDDNYWKIAREEKYVDVEGALETAEFIKNEQSKQQTIEGINFKESNDTSQDAERFASPIALNLKKLVAEKAEGLKGYRGSLYVKIAVEIVQMIRQGKTVW